MVVIVERVLAVVEFVGLVGERVDPDMAAWKH